MLCESCYQFGWCSMLWHWQWWIILAQLGYRECVNPHMRVKLKVFTIILNQNQIATYETVCVRCVCVNVIRAHSHSFHLPKKKFLMNVIILLLKQNKSALVCVCANSRRTETLNKLNLIYVVPNFLVL